jgi:hypothetical protein
MRLGMGVALGVAAGVAGAADATVAAGAESATAAAIRVVDCGTPVRSRKRGVCANHLSAADFAALAPGVAWFYNWHFRSDDLPAADLQMEFLPMVWGDRAEDVAGLSAWLAAGHRPAAVLAINEPNLRGQAFITPQAAAALAARVAAIAAPEHIPVVGPNLALGAAPADSITARDPLAGKDVTYTWFVPFLKAYGHFAGAGAAGAPVGIHVYKNVGELRWAVETAHQTTGGPVWVTEFAQWGADPAAERAFLIEAVDFLERTPYVAGYAWFKERMDKPSPLALLEAKDGTLTPLGVTYVAMPVHDPGLYWRVPGRLQAEDYAAAEHAGAKAVDDGDGFLEVDVEDQGWIDLNVQADHAGTRSVAIRVAGPGTLAVSAGAGERTVAVVAGWQTVTVAVGLVAGPQTVRLAAHGPVRMDWLDFPKP